MSEEANRHVRDQYRDLMVAVQDQTVAGEEGVTLDTIHDMVKRANEAFNQGNNIFCCFLHLLLLYFSVKLATTNAPY